MGRGAVQIVVALLDIFPVVPLRSGQSEQPLLQDRVAFVPQRDREAEASVVVADPQQAIFAPPVGARTGMIVREGVPGRAVRRVVLPHRTPLPLRQVRAPPVPALTRVPGGRQPLPLR